jgi:hypothetical protein
MREAAIIQEATLFIIELRTLIPARVLSQPRSMVM